MKDVVDICYYSSDFYAPYTGISMYSLCKNNEDVPFRLHCIDTGISLCNKEKMLDMAKSFGKELIFHDFSKLEAYIRDELKLPECSGSYATYIKVFPERIFTDIDKILFMDGDTIINGSIRPLLDMNIEEYVFAAAKVSLITEKHVYTDMPRSVRLEYALKFSGEGYYNIGVFYANLRRWKEVDFGNQIMRMRKEHIDHMQTAADVPIDEMLINLAALAHLDDNYVCQMPGIFNCTVHNIPHYRAWKANKCCGYISRAEFDETYYRPVIIHFCIFKPWYTDTFSPYRRILNRYINQSPWPDAFKQTMYNSPAEKFFGKYVYSMPSESLMMFTIQCGHFALRRHAQWLRLKAGISAKKEQRSERSAAAARAKASVDSVKAIPEGHLTQALRRRKALARNGRWREALAFPYKYLAEKFGYGKK